MHSFSDAIRPENLFRLLPRRCSPARPPRYYFEGSKIWFVWPDLTRRFVCMTDTAAAFAGFVSTEIFASPGGTLSKRKLPRLSARIRMENARIGAARFVGLVTMS